MVYFFVRVALESPIQLEETMVFVEFIATDGTNHYFVGVSVEAIMVDTKGGTEFGFHQYSSHREITEEEVRALGVQLLEEGIGSVKRGACDSFKLRTPQ